MHFILVFRYRLSNNIFTILTWQIQIQQTYIIVCKQKQSMSILSSRSQILKGTLSSSPTNQSPQKHNFSKFTIYDITDKNTKLLSSKKNSKHKRNLSLKGNLNPEQSETCNNLQDQSHLRKQFNMTANNNNKFERQATLPMINCKNKPFKRGTFLQLWLDQALDPQDLNKKGSSEQQQQKIHEQSKVVQTGKLKTMRKFQLDKQYLRSQNIPLDIIQRLYNSLYIYTHGVNSIFSELVGMVNNDQNRDSKTINIFWRAFIKLLQGCTSFQTSFQIVQQKHLRNVNELKDIIERKSQQNQYQKKQFEQKIISLQKQMISMQSIYSKLETDFKVNEATLLMTDQAFNEQVQLRLKFQQKVNHIYTSYDELKVKYQSLLHQVQQKILKQREFGSSQFLLQEKMRLMQAKNSELEHQLSLARLKVKDRDEEIAIKKQKLDELQVDKQMIRQRDEEEYSNIQQQISKNNTLKYKIQELNNRILSLQQLSKQQNKRIRDQNKAIQNYRTANEQIHQKYNILGKQLIQYQESKVFQSHDISRLGDQLAKAQKIISDLNSKNNSFSVKNDDCIKIIGQLQFELKSKTSVLQSNAVMIAQLKAVKDKHERLFFIVLKQKETLQKQRNSISEKYQLQQEEVVGLRMLIQSKDQSIRQIQIKNDKQKEVLKRKITGFSDAITKKQTSILSLNSKFQQSQKSKQTLKYRINLMEKQTCDLQISLKKKQSQNQFLFKSIEKQQDQKKQLTEKLKEIYEKFQKGNYELSLTQEKLGQKAYVIQSKNEQTNLQLQNIKKINQEYKILLVKTAMHIHPMHFQDIKYQLIRAQQKIQKMNIEISKMHQTINMLGEQILALNLTLTQKQYQIVTKEEEITKKSKIIIKISDQKDQLKKSLKQKQEKITKSNNQIQINKSNIQKLTQNVASITTIKEQLQNDIQKFKRQNTRKQIQIQKNINLMSVLSNKVAILNEELQARQKSSHLKERITELQAQVETLKNEIINLNTKPLFESVETQTQKHVQLERFSVPKFDHKKKFALQENQTEYNDKQVQTEGKLHLYQTVPEYIQGKINQIKSLKNKQQSSLDGPKQIQNKSKIDLQGSPTHYNQMKKVETKDYKRALKLTYMRR